MFIILQFNNLDLTLTKSMKRIYFVETVDLLFSQILIGFVFHTSTLILMSINETASTGNYRKRNMNNSSNCVK